jgi:hypothetical protein
MQLSSYQQICKQESKHLQLNSCYRKSVSKKRFDPLHPDVIFELLIFCSPQFLEQKKVEKGCSYLDNSAAEEFNQFRTTN